MSIDIVGRSSTEIVQIIAHCLVARVLMSLICMTIISIIGVKTAALFITVIVSSFERFRNHLDAARSIFSFSSLSLAGLPLLGPYTLFCHPKSLILIV